MSGRADAIRTCVVLSVMFVVLVQGWVQVSTGGVEDSGRVRYLVDGGARLPGHVRVLVDYGGFLLVDAPSGDDVPGGQKVNYTLTYNTRQVEFTGVSSAHSHHFLQLIGPTRTEWLKDLSSLGIRVGGYTPPYTYLVEGSPSALRTAEGRPWVNALTPYLPEHKISPRVGPGSSRLMISLFGADGMADLYRTTSALGGYVEASDDRYAIVRLDAGYIPTLARLEAVEYIEPARVKVPLLANATWVVQSGRRNGFTIWDRGLNGSGQIIGIADTGIDFDHEMFRDRNRSVRFTNVSSPQGPDLTHRKIVNYWYMTNRSRGDWLNGHGTHVAGIAAGNGMYISGYQASAHARGIAPGAKISFVDNEPDDPAPVNTSKYADWAYRDGARVQSNSWGSRNPDASYSAWARQFDEFVWRHPEMVVLVAAGNDGDLGAKSLDSPAPAKNIITVGATLNGDNMNDVAHYSSEGPTEDSNNGAERLKPDVMAPGDGVFSARSDNVSNSNNSGYISMDGTSMATPDTAGAAAIVRQYFTDGWYPGGTIPNPSAALIKGVLLAGTVEMTGAHSDDQNEDRFPNNSQGWGRINLERSLQFNGDDIELMVEDDRGGLVTGGTSTFYVDVKAESVPLRVMLVWSDYPGAVGAASALVNDLDLEVKAPNGTIYRGNNFQGRNPGHSVAGGVKDAINNVEGVILPPGFGLVKGTWEVTVRAANVAQGGTQSYAVVVTYPSSLQEVPCIRDWTDWCRSLGLDREDFFDSVHAGPDGAYVRGFISRIVNTSSLTRDARILAKYDRGTGAMKWMRTMPSLGYYNVGDSTMDMAGNDLYVTFQDDQLNESIRRYSLDGRVQWERRAYIRPFCPPFGDCVVKMQTDAGGNIYALLENKGSRPLARLIKFDRLGNVLWNVPYPADVYNTTFSDLTVTDGRVYTIGSFGDPITGTDLNLTLDAYDNSSGATIWSKRWQFQGNSTVGLQLAADPQGVYFTGAAGPSVYNANLVLGAFSPNGTLKWAEEWDHYIDTYLFQDGSDLAVHGPHLTLVGITAPMPNSSLVLQEYDRDTGRLEYTNTMPDNAFSWMVSLGVYGNESVGYDIYVAGATPTFGHGSSNYGDGLLLKFHRRLARLVITPDTVVVHPGQTLKFQTFALDQTNQTISEARVRWGVNDTSVGRIDPVTGEFTPGSFGNTTVWANVSYHGSVRVVYAAVRVSPWEIDRVVVTPVNATVEASFETEGLNFTASVYDKNNTDVTSLSVVRWSVDNTSLGKIDPGGGFLSRAGEGKVRVTANATYLGRSATATAEVDVVATLDTLLIDLKPDNIFVNESFNLTFTAKSIRGVVMGWVTPRWSVNDTTRASIDARGRVTGLSPGMVTVDLEVTHRGITRKDSFSMEVLPYLHIVKIDPQDATLTVGQALLFTAKAYDTQGQDMTSRVKLEWQVLEGIGSVGPDGRFTAGAPGKGYVMVVATFMGIVRSSSAEVTVEPADTLAPLGGPAGAAAIAIGSAIAAAAVIYHVFRGKRVSAGQESPQEQEREDDRRPPTEKGDVPSAGEDVPGEGGDGHASGGE